MNTFSLSTLIDDIMLIVRNNNISESEDLSRGQIASWIMHYRALLIKQKLLENLGFDDWFDECLTKTVGPISLSAVESSETGCVFNKYTASDKITDLLFDDPLNIISVTDENGCPILKMHSVRRHFHYFRKYTPRELTWDLENKELIVRGPVEYSGIGSVLVKYISSYDDADSEDDIQIPGWMVPVIKDNIFKNELSFMLKMPSDDDNNSTLAGIKPHGPQDQEK